MLYQRYYTSSRLFFFDVRILVGHARLGPQSSCNVCDPFTLQLGFGCILQVPFATKHYCHNVGDVCMHDARCFCPTLSASMSVAVDGVLSAPQRPNLGFTMTTSIHCYTCCLSFTSFRHPRSFQRRNVTRMIRPNGCCGGVTYY